MSLFEKYEEMLPDYLAGRLADDQRLELEQQLEISEELRQALVATRMLAAGLAVYDLVEDDHIASATLVRYCDDPDSLKDSDRRDLEAHLAGCEECRQEITLCRIGPEQGAARSGLLNMATNWLFAPRMTLRPVYAVIAAGLVVAFIGYYGFGTGNRVPARAEFRLEPVSRDVRSANILVIESGTEVAKLEFIIPSRPGCSYDMELSDSTDLVIFIRPSLPAKDLQIMDIPTSYLADGRYKLMVLEISTGLDPVEIAAFEFRVRIDPK